VGSASDLSSEAIVQLAAAGVFITLVLSCQYLTRYQQKGKRQATNQAQTRVWKDQNNLPTKGIMKVPKTRKIISFLGSLRASCDAGERARGPHGETLTALRSLRRTSGGWRFGIHHRSDATVEAKKFVPGHLGGRAGAGRGSKHGG